MVNQKDYSKKLVDAAYSVLIEVVRILGEYQEDIVVIGGWVPQLLLPDAKDNHTGSIDVDLALNHLTLTDAGYKTILESLHSRGYEQGNQPFTFFRTVVVDGEEVGVEVDFLAGEYGGTGRGRRTQIAQDVRARKARGADLVFQAPERIRISGKLPDGGDDTADILVAPIPTLIVMKAFAMNTRLKEKDPWDIYFCLKNHSGGIEAIAEEFRAYKENSLVKEALVILAKKFVSPSAVGPTHIVQFENITDPEERDLIQRDAFERVNLMVALLMQ